MASYDKAFNFVIGQEGGFVNDPDDPGGMTKYGISKRQYKNLDIRNLTLRNAKEIYRSDYWDRCKCDQLPESIKLAVFDASVNQGVKTAIKLLQRTIGATEDGIIGPETIGLASSGQSKVLEHYLTERALYYTKINKGGGFKKYGRGWLRRLFHVATAR